MTYSFTLKPASCRSAGFFVLESEEDKGIGENIAIYRCASCGSSQL